MPKRNRDDSGSSSSRKKRQKRARSESESESGYESDSDHEQSRARGRKWTSLQHRGPLFAPPYKPLPGNVKLLYDGKPVKLSKNAEEAAGFYAKFVGSAYAKKPKFRKNFFNDWLELMGSSDRKVIKDLNRCDFREIRDHYADLAAKKKELCREEKQRLKDAKEKVMAEYSYCRVDGREEKIGNVQVEPPGLFLGRGEHPRMGCIKSRIQPEDVIVNCSGGSKSKIPKAPSGHRWKQVRHDSTVSWLASWTDSITGQPKYIMLNGSSKLKGGNDRQKYELARELGTRIRKIRKSYGNDLDSSTTSVQQLAVATYLIDRLSLRVGNEKGKDTADTVGCCSLRHEHLKLQSRNHVQLTFLGKDSIQYDNTVQVDTKVYRNLKSFLRGKKGRDKIFDRINTRDLNNYLSELMDGLSAKVFRTYNASDMLEKQLAKLTPRKGSLNQNISAYHQANREVARLCNHKRAVPKSFDTAMKKLEDRIERKEDTVEDLEEDLSDLKRGTSEYARKKKSLDTQWDALEKLKLARKEKEEGKDIALGTSKLNYCDPRITARWCEQYDVPTDKIYTKTQREKFSWALDRPDRHFQF